MFMKRFISCGRIKRPHLGRSDRPECRADAPFLFDDVYKNSTREEKKQADARQYGRSMVEMLGVLAIIGVLSVGGIAGYNKAIFKHRLNKQAEVLDQLFSIMTRYKDEWHFYRAVNLIPYYTKIGEISQDMIGSNDNMLYDAFKNKIWLTTNNCTGQAPCDETLLSYGMTGQTNFDLCHNIFKVGISYAEYLRYFSVTVHVNAGDSASYLNRYNGDKYCSKKRNDCIRGITMDDIYDICQTCKDKNSCSFIFIWK